jgi:hypothetical protein
MIDDPDVTTRLLKKMEAHLPIPAQVTPEVRQMMCKQKVIIPASRRVQIERVFYAGDEGGIVWSGVSWCARPGGSGLAHARANRSRASISGRDSRLSTDPCQKAVAECVNHGGSQFDHAGVVSSLAVLEISLRHLHARKQALASRGRTTVTFSFVSSIAEFSKREKIARG